MINQKIITHKEFLRLPNRVKSQKKKIGICLSVIAIIIVLIIGISVFGNMNDGELVGTWRSELNSSTVTFTDSGAIILSSSDSMGERVTYRVDGNTLTMIFATDETASFDFKAKGDTLILGGFFYKSKIAAVIALSKILNL